MSKASEPTQAEINVWLDVENKRTAQIIRRSGVFIQSVGADPEARATCFAYTVGLFSLGHPELLLLGLCGDAAARVMNPIAALIRRGVDLAPTQILQIDGNRRRFTVEQVPNPARILYAANAYYQRPDVAPVPAFQLTYDDDLGHFPWEEGYAIAPWVQPRPGEFRA